MIRKAKKKSEKELAEKLRNPPALLHSKCKHKTSKSSTNKKWHPLNIRQRESRMVQPILHGSQQTRNSGKTRISYIWRTRSKVGSHHTLRKRSPRSTAKLKTWESLWTRQNKPKNVKKYKESNNTNSHKDFQRIPKQRLLPYIMENCWSVCLAQKRV